MDVPKSHANRWRFAREPEFWLVLALASAIFLPRLSQLSIRGEESRRAQVAAEILRTGDWVVPRQQGEVYVSRPPVGSWPIAMVALLRGDLDIVAVRLPTALATIGTCLLIYAYARHWLSKLGALAAGVAYATMAQVLELGMIAETESSLTILVAGSLFLWHAAYASGRLTLLAWALCYALAALAGLTKGPQGPVYFVAVTTVYLWIQRDWRTWLSWRHAGAALAMLGIVGAWQILFTMRTDWVSSQEIWLHNASDRFVDSSWTKLARHMALYPLEIVACTLPWSLMLIAYCYPRVRARLDHTAPLVKFLVIAILVTFPTCWLAATARGRYFMPLYPCIAVLVGVAIDRIVQLAQDAQLGYAIQRFLWPCAVILPLGAVALLGVGMLEDSFDGDLARAWSAATDSPWTSVAFTMLATMGGWLVARAAREVSPERVRWALLAIAGFIGLTYMGPITNVRIAHSEETARQVNELKSQLPADARNQLVSVGRVHHLFAYHYRDPIRVLPPQDLRKSARGDWEYFCFDQHGPDGPELPFPWEQVAVISCERNRVKNPQQLVIIGRRLTETGHTAGRGETHGRK